MIATIYYFASPVDSHFINFFERVVEPAVTESGASVLAYFVTDASKNTFPMLPVREGENVFIWFSRFANQAAHERYLDALNRSQKWRDEVAKELARQLKKTPEIVRLSPTTRSQLR